jgi:hypothetical protein
VATEEAEVVSPEAEAAQEEVQEPPQPSEDSLLSL